MVFAFALVPWRAPRDRQLQLRPPDWRRRLARGAGVDGDRPTPRPPRDAVQRRHDGRRGMSSEAPRSQPPARHPRAGSRSIVRTAVTDSQLASAPGSERVAVARARARERLHRQRQTLRPLGWAVILVVVLGSANSDPVPGLHGKSLAVTLALCVFAVTLAVVIRDSFPERSLGQQAGVIAVMGPLASRSPGSRSGERPRSRPLSLCSWRAPGCRSTPASRWVAR
jgi:hypothetical protein